MKRQPVLATIAALALSLGLVGYSGCSNSKTAAEKPSFTLAWSEYPSWSVFGVAAEKGLINGEKGKLGRIEEKWGVDIVLKEADYDPCITMYNSLATDAVCVTNMDVLNPALGRKSVAVLPTSTSVGADMCIVTGIKNVQELRKYKVYGLAKSVSEYAFVRNLEKLGEKESDHHFENMDPAAAASAMQTNQKGYEAIMVWNPYSLQTLKVRKDARVLFDSSSIPEEIIDMVVVGQDVLEKPGGKDFVCAVIDTYYEFNRMLADKAQHDELVLALGTKFSNLNAAEMEKAVEQTRFYKTPEEALKLFKGEQFPKTMKLVHDFCLSHKIVEKEVSYGFGAGNAQLRFDPSYIEQVRDKK